jgi:hypothetical protein
VNRLIVVGMKLKVSMAKMVGNISLAYEATGIARVSLDGLSERVC